jgi:hypothetical protein
MNATEAIDKIVSLLGLQFKKQVFASTFLTDGTEVTNNMSDESDFEVGQTLYVVKESTLAPAPEGSHETREGLIVTVDAESTIIAIASKDVEETEVGVEVETEDDMKKEKMTIAEDTKGNRLESPTFDVGEMVYVLTGDDTKTPAPDGEHQVVLKDESGNENKIRIITKDGVITERENVEEMGKDYEMSKEIENIKSSMTEMLGLINELNGKFKTELNSLKSDFDTFKKSPERKSVEEKKTYKENFEDYKLDLIKSLRKTK